MQIDICDSNQVQKWGFPGGERGVRLSVAIQSTMRSLETVIKIKTRLRNSDDLIDLLLVTDAIRKLPYKSISLFVPYFPYARQDRVCNIGESLSIKVITDLINSQQYKKVTIFDPHSEVTPALINNVKVIDCTWLANKIEHALPKNYILISPDFGATKRINKIAKALNYTDGVLQFEKTRNLMTGEITGIDTVTGYCDFGGKTFVIFDDIIDGGGTFVAIAKKLKEGGANKVILAVSHGIFSKGIECIYEYIDQIFTTNSFSEIERGDWCKFNPKFELANFIQHDIYNLEV